MKFFKYSGNGNDFIILDHPERIPTEEEIIRWCDRHFGIGADGVLLLVPESGLDGRMRIFNADGGEAEMCANGLRCLFTHVDRMVATKKPSYKIATMNGVYEASALNGKFAVTMSEVRDENLYQVPSPGFEKSYFINTGVPHLVLLGKKIREFPIQDLAPYRYHQTFPRGSNVSLVEVLGEQKAYVRTYERGVEDETYSCGTGLTATALALRHWFSWTGMITLETKGGVQEVHLGQSVRYAGEVTFCFSGETP